MGYNTICINFENTNFITTLAKNYIKKITTSDIKLFCFFYIYKSEGYISFKYVIDSE